MAQLKDLIVTGASRFIGDVIANQILITTLKAPTEAGGSSYGTGSNGQVLLSNGSSVYWGSAAPTVTESTVSGWGFTKNTGTITGATTNGGLKVTGTTLGHSNATITAKTTAGVYPVKIDALGHITEAGTAIVSSTAASGGTTLSLVTTGEKYTWNNKSSLAIGTTATTAAAGNHTHTTSLAADSGTATVTLAHNTTYKLTAGGTNVIFKTPADNNTDTKVNVINRGTTKSYLLATTTAPTGTATGVTAVAESGVYLDTTAAKLVATTFKGALEGNATSATKATNDGDNNAINTTYLKKSGGDMLGMLGLKGIKGTSGTDYGSTLPLTGTEGLLFFLVDDGSNIATGLSNTVNLLASLSDSTAVSFDGTQTGTLTIGTTGTLPVSKGGTGATSFTANSVIMSGNSTTAALTTRAVTNNSSNTAITASTNIPTMNTIYYGLATINGSSLSRATAIYAPTTAGALNSILVSSGSGAPGWKATTAGVAYVSANAGALTFGTAPVNLGGTGATTFTSGNVLVGNGTSAITTIGKASTNTASTLVLRDSSGNFSAGTITANLTGVASKATAANITSTTNGIAVYSNTSGTFTSKATAAGAVYVTEANGVLNFGNLPVNKGGTGADTATAACTNLKAFNLDRGTEIPANSNLNNYTTVGIYYSSDSTRSATLTNPPCTDAGFKLVVLALGATTNLKLLAFRNSSNKIFVRYYASSTWGSWAEIPFTGSDNSYVKKAGDTLGTTAQISRVGISSSWYNGRDKAIIRLTSYTGYNPIVSMKTTNGSWEMGPYTSDILYFVYNSDTGYNSGTNTTGEYVNTVRITKTGLLYGAVWNDYAEFRETKVKVRPGQCVVETGSGDLVPSTDRLLGGAEIVSDTYGFGVGQSLKCNTPIACSGRVLAYPLEDKKVYLPGDAVCSGPNGTISKMTREEIKEWPDRIIGTVSEIPNYEVWQAGSGGAREEIKIDGRIWIRIR